MIANDDRFGLMDEFLGPEELAKLLGRSEGTLARWRSARTGPKATKLGNRVVYHKDDVDAWIAERRAGRS